MVHVTMNPELKEKLEQLQLNQATSGKSITISEDRFNDIVHHLQNPEVKVSAQFKHWVKTRLFQIVDLPGYGLKGVLVIPNKNPNEGGSAHLRVVHHKRLFDVVQAIHADELKHSGYKKVLEYVSFSIYESGQSISDNMSINNKCNNFITKS
jgi:hypothetical protein